MKDTSSAAGGDEGSDTYRGGGEAPCTAEESSAVADAAASIASARAMGADAAGASVAALCAGLAVPRVVIIDADVARLPSVLQIRHRIVR